jgi:hypothetical protein
VHDLYFNINTPHQSIENSIIHRSPKSLLENEWDEFEVKEFGVGEGSE